MAIPVGAILILVLPLAILLLGWFAYRRGWLQRVKFSLRTLLIFVAVIGLMLGGWLQFQRRNRIHIEWLALGSKEALALFPAPVIEPNPTGDEWHTHRFVYYMRHTTTEAIVGALRDGHSKYHLETITFDATEENAQKGLAAIQSADVAPRGNLVIRGELQERDNKPVAREMIELHGPYGFIEHCQTRDDGTFTMPIQPGLKQKGEIWPPPGVRYYFRVRVRETPNGVETSWDSNRFKLDPAKPEMDVRLRLPR